MIAASDYLRLGRTDLKISPIGLGSWSWGDRIFWSYGITHSREDVERVFDKSIAAGINFIDTAEAYGFGRSERILGDLLRRTNRDLVIGSKFFPFPWRLTTSSLIHGLKGSLRRLGLEMIDLYMIHWPLPPLRVERWVESLVHAYEEGLIKAIGISNFDLAQMRRAQAVLDKHGLHLSANQIHFSMLHHQPERSGLINACIEDDVTILAYSPLAQGLLTGKYSPGSPPPKGVMRLGNRGIISRLQPLITLMRDIGDRHGGKSPAQIAINWTLVKGAVPIVGAKNKSQASENLGAFGWSLSFEDVNRLDIASEDIQLSFPMKRIARG